MKKYFKEYPGTPPLNVKGDYRSSVHYGNTYRLDKAKEQVLLPTVEVSKISEYVVEFLKMIGIEKNSPLLINNPEQINYKGILRDYKLDDSRDMLWMKFTKDGYLGVVARGNDINFDFPDNEQDYDNKIEKYNPFTRKKEMVWKHATSGILVHQVDKEWDKSFVLVFPLPGMSGKKYTTDDVERAVGNYLIDKGVPIIDFYSHNY